MYLSYDYGSAAGTTWFGSAQLEAGSLTSYIHTTTAAVTRPADVATVTAPAGSRLRVWTVDGARSSAAQAPGSVALPVGTMRDIRFCRTSTTQRDCQ
jgi:hypothetical protein